MPSRIPARGSFAHAVEIPLVITLIHASVKFSRS